jgi:hypothetical protein
MEEAIQPVSPGFNLSLTIKVPFERLTGGIIKARPHWIVDTVRRVQDRLTLPKAVHQSCV